MDLPSPAALPNQFIQLCGIHLEETPDGSFFGWVDLVPELHNPYGIAHGGLLYTLADTTAGCNARRFVRHPVTLNSDFHFLRNTASGRIVAHAEAVRTGGRVSVFRVNVARGDGLLLAEGTFTFYHRD